MSGCGLGETSVECGILMAEIMSLTMTVEHYTTVGDEVGFNSVIGYGAMASTTLWDDFTITNLSVSSAYTLEVDFQSDPTLESMWVRFPSMTGAAWIEAPRIAGVYQIATTQAVYDYLVAADATDITVEVTTKKDGFGDVPQ